MDIRCNTETLAVRGLRYHLRVWGHADAPPVFLLHGLLDTGATFTPLVDALQHDWRVIAPDWRGHGDSDHDPNGYWFPDYVADLDLLVEHYAPAEPARLVAHSMGATAASLYAGLRPDRVSHLVCLDALNVPTRTAEMAPKRYRQWLDAQRNPPGPKTYTDVNALVARLRLNYPELKTELVERLAQEWSRPAAGGGIRLINDPRHHIVSPYGFNSDHAIAVWRQVTARVFCLDAGDSQVSQFTDAQEMTQRRAAFRHLRHEVLPDCGHMLHLQRPKAVDERIEPFLYDQELLE